MASCSTILLTRSITSNTARYQAILRYKENAGIFCQITPGSSLVKRFWEGETVHGNTFVRSVLWQRGNQRLSQGGALRLCPDDCRQGCLQAEKPRTLAHRYCCQAGTFTPSLSISLDTYYLRRSDHRSLHSSGMGTVSCDTQVSRYHLLYYREESWRNG